MALPALQNTGVLFRRILAQFPQDISLAFAYGSGVFKQSGTSQGQMGRNMLDFVFAVDDPVTWHTMNLMQNRKHYSFLKYLGPKQISAVQSDHGAAVYYNTLVPADDRVIKYGVISTEALVDDLLHWKTLYVAGRLHKPVHVLVLSENAALRAALVGNLKSAVTASFLMLPESFSEEDLFMQIAGLSFSGDFRMMIGEDRSKVSNIVKDNMQHFRVLYNNILVECPQVVYKPQQGRLEVDKSPEGQFAQLMALPRTLQQQITRLVDPPGKNRDVEEILLQVAQDPDCGTVIQQGIASIVKSSSITQSVKGIATAGVWKTVSYSSKKLHKMWKGWRRKSS
ncbi:phosphatidate cytidylyltransferase, mitochondrial-like [Denticeps clupeoides]|uniref:Phosphatidate cytidylyltransferase, mitochondrial n=1 Tax=Denticeps clupeoides TaxID=299321 RepID=A0A8C4GCI1_9TELE|nr:phosphatidate cytidylyltransferase, mitochondrial-like [Denticeps clupeoides]XP_028855075.1 phosphatidate cytidylyltransferase, mitochondrial-like [Denticeps clupeoides]